MMKALQRKSANLIQIGVLTGFLTGVTACGAQASDGDVPTPPNVLFIAIDDLNDWVGCLDGHPNAQTPNIDALARRGVLFANAHCTAPICGPSRASIFTGLHPITSGIYLQIADGDIRDSNEATRSCTFLPDYFEQHGYRTFGVGKLYHNGDQARTFDEYGGKFAWMGPKPDQRFHYDPAWYGKPGGTQTDWAAYPERDEEMADYNSAQWAIDRLRESQSKPFFLAVGFVRPHVPWYVPARWFDRHPLEGVHTPPYREDDLDDVPAMGRHVAAVPMMPTTKELRARGQWKQAVQAYLACCTWTDHWVGEVLKALDASPYAKNTLIVLWSDHGYHLGEKGRFAKQALWERDTRVPLIFSGPRIDQGRRCDQPVSLLDLYPTLLDLCGLPANPRNDGRSLAPLLRNPRAFWDRPAVIAYGPVNFAVRSAQYRTLHYEDGSVELYDLRTDPNEWDNLAGKPEFAAILERHTSWLPSNPAPLAPGSEYSINPYFRERLDRWRK